MRKTIGIAMFVAVCAGIAWAGGVGSYCTSDSQCTVGGYKLVCNSYYHTCEQAGGVGTHCLRDADCRYPLYCAASYGYRCLQRQYQ